MLDDADLQKSVVDVIGRCYLNSGQTCSALTRMLVPRERLPEAEAIAAAVAAQIKVGDPFDQDTTIGPLVSDAQRERVRGYIRKGQEEGAKLVAGGEDAPAGADKGYFVQPTVFSEVDPAMTIAQEEIFGPVLSIIPYDSEDDAIRIANDSVYGLAGGVWSGDPERAQRVARRIRTGQVEINGATFNPLAPFGGYKQAATGVSWAASASRSSSRSRRSRCRRRRKRTSQSRLPSLTVYSIFSGRRRRRASRSARSPAAIPARRRPARRGSSAGGGRLPSSRRRPRPSRRSRRRCRA